MAKIEDLLAIINDNPKALKDMSDEELLKVLEPCIALEPKPLPKPAVAALIDGEEKEEDDPNPFKVTKKKSRKEKISNALSEADKFFKGLEE
jgi:hypothetical protein